MGFMLDVPAGIEEWPDDPGWRIVYDDEVDPEELAALNERISQLTPEEKEEAMKSLRMNKKLF